MENKKGIPWLGIGLIFLLLFIANAITAMATPVVVIFNQTPADITTTNIKNTPLVVFVNITTVSDINNATVKIYFKTNTSTSDISYWVNGTSYDAWNNTRSYDSNYTYNLYKFIGYENAVYPGIYNFQWLWTRKATHLAATLPTSNDWLKVQIWNVSSTEGENYVAYMLNNTAGTDYAKVYYCNNSYTTGAVTTSSWCVFIYNTPSNNWDHCHPGNNSCHFVAPFPIVSGKVGTIDVTSTSYFLFNGRSGSTVQYWYITNSTRSGATMTTGNNGVTWTNQVRTADVNLKQFDGSDVFTYMVCASNSTGSQGCSAEISQTLLAGDTGPLPTIGEIITPFGDTSYCPITTTPEVMLFIFLGLLVIGFMAWASYTSRLIISIIAGFFGMVWSFQLFACYWIFGAVVMLGSVLYILYEAFWRFKE